MIYNRCLHNLKSCRDIDNKLRENLSHKNVSHDQHQPQHNRHVENINKISVRIKPKNSEFCVKRKLTPSEKVPKSDQIEREKEVVNEQISKSWHLWFCVVSI